MPGAHRVVGIGEIDQRCIFASHGVEQRIQVLVVIAERHGDKLAAKACDMEIEGWIGTERGDDRGSWLDDQPDNESQKPVYAFADHHPFRRQAEMRAQRHAQIMVLWIGVAPAERGFARDCLNHRRGRTKTVFIGAKPRLKLRTTRPLLGFRPDERHGGRQ